MGTRLFVRLKESVNTASDESLSVNLGGWFVLEPFITPTLFQKYQPAAVDEWTISVAMAADTASGGLTQLENHYKTFIVSTLKPTSRLETQADEYLAD